MTNMQPIPQVPGNNDDDAQPARVDDAMGGGGDDQPLDADLDDANVDSAAADVQAATEGTRDSDDDR